MKFRNEYKQLKQENNLIFSTLAECDRDTITDILNTISNSRGINYDVELVRKDLIAMGGQRRGRRPIPAPPSSVTWRLLSWTCWPAFPTPN